MNSQLNDEELINQHRLTQASDCFEALYTRYVDKVFKQCLSITKDTEQAQDFTQDIFIRTFDRLDKFQERSKFSTWLYSISYNYCIDQIRVAKRLTTTPLEDGLEHQYTNSQEEELDERLPYLAKAMKTLSEAEATILCMKYEDGLDIHQIARQLRLNESAVKMRLKRTRDKIRQFYDQVTY